MYKDSKRTCIVLFRDAGQSNKAASSKEKSWRIYFELQDNERRLMKFRVSPFQRELSTREESTFTLLHGKGYSSCRGVLVQFLIIQCKVILHGTLTVLGKKDC